MSAGSAPALELRGISKRFGSVAALSGAGIVVRPGTVHALLGENGAGKTTLMRVAFGLVAPDAGTIERHGTRMQFHAPSDAIRARIGMVHQHFSLVASMTVAENVALGDRGPFNARSAAERVQNVSRGTGFALDPNARTGDLPIAVQQRVEIVKAFAHGATLLILDEPTAVLAPQDASELLGRLRVYARSGNAVVLITHKLRDALAWSDELTVLRGGATVLTCNTPSADESQLVDAMIGSSGLTQRKRADARRTPGEPVMRLDGVSVRRGGIDRLRNANLVVGAGEIVGVAGVEGSGQRELLRVLSGRIRPTAGRADVPALVGFVPEDRQRDAVVAEFTLTENAALAGAGARRGRMDWLALRRSTQQIVEQFDVRASGIHAPMATLSGGNQQRFVVGRELHAAPRALVVENPSRGLDVRAAQGVHARLLLARDNGCAVVVHSSDVDELLALADRVVVCFEGETFDVEFSREAIGRALVGARA